MSQERTIQCPICGKPYKVYPFTTADQSACPSCVREAEQDSYKEQPWPNPNP